MRIDMYLPFIVSILGTLFTGLWAWFNSRPKAQTDRFSSLIKAYAELNDDLQVEVRRQSDQIKKLLLRIQELELTEQKLEAKVAHLIEECGQRPPPP